MSNIFQDGFIIAVRRVLWGETGAENVQLLNAYGLYADFGFVYMFDFAYKL